MNQITTRYVTENGACYEQYVITDAEAKTELVITPERGGMITGFSLNGEEYIWTRHPNFAECNRPRFGVPVLFPNCGLPDNGVHIFDGKAYPMENHGFADLCAWDVESVGPDGVTLILESTPLTKFLYPFDFTVLMNYNLEGNTAAINMTVINEGDTNMPFSFGFHPYFKASKLENVDFDIKCATCSESAKGEQPAAPEKITLTRKEGADNSVRLLTGVQFPMTLTDSGNGHKVTVDADDSFDHAVLWQQDADEVGLPSEHAGEDWARRLRYACFARLCGEGIDVVATAHTANDQAETLLLRLARGTGLHGAAGIRPKRGCYLRPLLALTRQDTESFCRAAGQAWVTDETNATDAYARNRVRRAALPALQSTNGAAVENLARFCEKAARADAYFARKAEELLSAARLDAAQAAIKSPEACTVWRLGPLSAADALILEAAMHSLTAPVRDAEEKYVQLLCGLVRRGSGAVQLTDRVRFCAGDGCFWQEIVPERSRQQEDKRPESQPFQPEKQAEYCLAGGWKVTAGLFTADFEEKIQVVHKKDLKNQADYARITTLYAGLVLRTRQPGDVYRPAGRSVHNRLRKWMNETGIPASQRDQLPLLAAGSEVLWVCGAGFAEGLAPDADTAQVLQMEMEHREEIT